MLGTQPLSGKLPRHALAGMSPTVALMNRRSLPSSRLHARSAPNVLGENSWKQPVVVEGAVLAERAELPVEQPPDLDAAFAALGAEHAHPPRGPAGGVGGGDRQQADGALDDPAAFQLIEVGGVRFRGRADPDHAAGGERARGEHEHREQHERGGAPVPAPRPRWANPAPGANRAAQLALELVEHVVHASSLRLARSVFRPRCTR